eukprot:13222189-Alexandrium_andersonii.AAC.1
MPLGTKEQRREQAAGPGPRQRAIARTAAAPGIYGASGLNQFGWPSGATGTPAPALGQKRFAWVAGCGSPPGGSGKP